MASDQGTWTPWQVESGKLQESKPETNQPEKGRSSYNDEADTAKRLFEEEQQPREDEGRIERSEETLPRIDRIKLPELLEGSAESRGPRGYDAGNTKDSLFNGGGSRPVPDGLRRMAGGGGGEKYDDEQNAGDDGAAGGGDGGGGGGDDDGNEPAEDEAEVEVEKDTGPTEAQKTTINLKINQGRFEEALVLQMKLVLESGSRLEDSNLKIQNMAMGWRKMGEVEWARALVLMYLQSLPRPLQIPVLDKMIGHFQDPPEESFELQTMYLELPENEIYYIELMSQILSFWVRQTECSDPVYQRYLFLIRDDEECGRLMESIEETWGTKTKPVLWREWYQMLQVQYLKLTMDESERARRLEKIFSAWFDLNDRVGAKDFQRKYLICNLTHMGHERRLQRFIESGAIFLPKWIAYEEYEEALNLQTFVLQRAKLQIGVNSQVGGPGRKLYRQLFEEYVAVWTRLGRVIEPFVLQQYECFRMRDLGKKQEAVEGFAMGWMQQGRPLDALAIQTLVFRTLPSSCTNETRAGFLKGMYAMWLDVDNVPMAQGLASLLRSESAKEELGKLLEVRGIRLLPPA